MFPCNADIGSELSVFREVQLRADPGPVTVDIIEVVRVVGDVGTVSVKVQPLVPSGQVELPCRSDVPQITGSDAGAIAGAFLVVFSPVAVGIIQIAVEIGAGPSDPGVDLGVGTFHRAFVLLVTSDDAHSVVVRVSVTTGEMGVAVDISPASSGIEAADEIVVFFRVEFAGNTQKPVSSRNIRIAALVEVMAHVAAADGAMTGR